MVLWFVATAIVSVWFVFRDPRFDYRLLIIGSVLPLADGVTGGASVLHTLAVCLLVLVVVMLATIGRRATRKLWLGLPIGMLLHLVYDGVWNDTDLFWWPLGGFGFDGTQLPELARGRWDVLLELVGAAVLVWVWRSSRLSDPAARRQFLRDGRLFTGTA
jgi:hypothetical protein